MNKIQLLSVLPDGPNQSGRHVHLQESPMTTVHAFAALAMRRFALQARSRTTRGAS